MAIPPRIDDPQLKKINGFISQLTRKFAEAVDAVETRNDANKRNTLTIMARIAEHLKEEAERIY
jgi:hypothetical protein